MRFLASGCEYARPIIDVITFSINYGYSKQFYADLLDVIARNGNTFQTRKNDTGRECKYIPTLNMTLEEPSNTLYGWGRIYFCPTKTSLNLLQRWLWEWVAGDAEVMQNKIHLSRCELAYDFYIPNKGYSFHAGLAKRLWWYIWPIKGQSLYASYMADNLDEMWFWPIYDKKSKKYMLFTSFEDALIYYGKCGDGAINGDFTGYIQVCPRKYKQYSAHSLNPNGRASKHTTIYPKGIDEVWRVRVEMELAKSAIKKLHFQNTNFACLLDNLPNFDEVYEFRDVDFTTFRKHIFSLPESNALRFYVWQKRIDEVEYMPTVDKIRMMRAMADKVGNKRLKDGILKKYSRLMSFTEVLNTRLASTSSPSRRMEKGEKPDGIPFMEWLGMLVKIGNKEMGFRSILDIS